MTKNEWRQPVEGFEFAPEKIVVGRAAQTEKLSGLGLPVDVFGDFVDASFFIGIGIHAGISNGISAQGNVNMVQTLKQHRRVMLDEELTVRGYIRSITEVPRGVTIDTEVWFEGSDGERAITASRKSLKPDPDKAGVRGAGQRPAAVIEDIENLRSFSAYQLTPEIVRAYSSEGNDIHYDMTAANKAGFRAPLIGGGMGVHYLLATLWQHCSPTRFELDIYFRRPIFWDDEFTVTAIIENDSWQAMGLIKNAKVLTEARITGLS